MLSENYGKYNEGIFFMKYSYFSKYIYIFLFIYTALFGAVSDKSAIVYYGKHISYPMVGIHNYIIVQPQNINTYSHGFDVYKNKMYAYVSVGEINTNIKEYKKVKKSWILGKNGAWGSKILDLTNPQYQKFFFKEQIEPQMKRGFKNFFFDTLDSYQLVRKTAKEREKSKKALALLINNFHKKYPDSKLVINRGFEIIDKVHNSVNAVLFESYYSGLGGKNLGYKKVSDSDREWLDTKISKIKSYNLDVIAVDYLPYKRMNEADEIIKKIKKKGMIPYIANRSLNIYGKSSKNPVKRDILTLIDEEKHDRVFSSAHQYGALPLEYMGYIERLYNVNKRGLPKLNEMSQYAGVIVWLDDYYHNPHKLIKWVASLKRIGLKVAFLNNFGRNISKETLKPLNINLMNVNGNFFGENTIVHQDKMIGFEIKPSKNIGIYLRPKNSKELLTIENKNHKKSTLAAITPWGGYAIDQAYIMTIGDDNIWVINPFEFLAKALRLKKLIVPDPTTENGTRLLFTHVDGDGFMNRVEWNPKLFSGGVMLNEILKVYKIPHSISVVGAEVEPDGMYPKLVPQLTKIEKEIYALKNVEGATHTFSHPFKWGQIKHGNLSPKYRLKVKGYKFSLDKEILGSLKYINTKFIPKGRKKAHTVFWSGDCQPPEKILDYMYKHKILNMNGGDTYITNSQPWQSYIAPFGIERGDYYQIYTGEQDENVYTNDWLGPFWGFKKVVQTFKLTNSPRRFKVVDIYYHPYSGSKRASVNALKYVFDWAIKQDLMPIYTTEYIPKAMDFYTVSISHDDGEWLFSGMKSIKTVRIEQKGAGVNFRKSKNVLGFKHFENHTYVSIGRESSAIVTKTDSSKDSKDWAYLVSANAKVSDEKFSKHGFYMNFDGYVGVRVKFHIPKSCSIKMKPRARIKHLSNDIVSLRYNSSKKVGIDVICK